VTDFVAFTLALRAETAIRDVEAVDLMPRSSFSLFAESIGPFEWRFLLARGTTDKFDVFRADETDLVMGIRGIPSWAGIPSLSSFSCSSINFLSRSFWNLSSSDR